MLALNYMYIVFGVFLNLAAAYITNAQCYLTEQGVCAPQAPHRVAMFVHYFADT